MCVVRCAWYSSTGDELRSRRAEHVTIPRTTYQRTILSGAPDSLRFGGYWPGAPILSSASARGCSSAGRAPGSHPGGQGFEPPQLHLTRCRSHVTRDTRCPRVLFRVTCDVQRVTHSVVPSFAQTNRR